MQICDYREVNEVAVVGQRNIEYLRVVNGNLNFNKLLLIEDIKNLTQRFVDEKYFL